MSEEKNSEVGGYHAKIALSLLVLVYIFNFIDRQILSILAEDIKADLGISNSDIGFLFGTAFGVFYSVVGIPMGKLADSWNRKNLISIGLAFWSFMTFLSGTAKSFLSLSIYRFGVGIGESSATLCILIALRLFFTESKGYCSFYIFKWSLYRSGYRSFFRGAILDTWNSAYPDHTQAPFQLKGWQAAFMGVGLPGIILSVFTFLFIREPVRGLSEGIKTEPSKEPFKETFKEFIGLTPLSLLGNKDTLRSLGINLIVGAIIFLLCFSLYKLTGDFLQWIAWV